MIALLGFDLLRPGALVWALAGVAVGLVGLLGLRARSRALDRLVAPRHRARFLPGFSVNRARARLALATFGLLLLAFAVAGPVRGYTVRDVKRRGLDLVVCVDTSRSMLVRDLRPDRISRARREVSGLLDRLRDDRMAILAFAGDAREIAPLTHDKTTLRALLGELRPGDNTMGGTNIGGALERALALFDGRTGAHEAIVLLTDGEDLEGRGLEVAQGAAERGIRVFVVGMGSESGGKIPTRAPDGSEQFVQDEEGAEVVSSMDGSSLAALADATGGAYLSAQSSPTPLEDLYEHRILRLEGRAIDTGQEWLPHDRFQWPGALALLCIALESALRERRGRVSARGGVRRRAVRAAAAALALAGLGAVALAQGPAPTGPVPTGPAATAPGVATSAEAQAVAPWPGAPRAGLEELQARARAADHPAALAAGTALLARSDLAEPLRAEVHFNLGVVRAEAGAVTDPAARAVAAADFERAAALAGPGTLRLDALYDVATLELLAAEELRTQVPEVREKLGMPPLPASGPSGVPPVPGGLGGPGAPGAEAPDVLPEAIAAYERARDGLVRRLRADWRDEDTRANLELTGRRLRELREIEAQRERDEQEQDPEQEPSEDPQDQEGEDGEQGEENPQDGEPPEGEQEPQEDQEPQDPQDEEGEQQEPEGQDDEPQDEEPAPPEDSPEEGEAPPESGEPTEPEERVLSREEVQRLLDRLQEIEEEARALDARLRAQRRVPVRRDW